MKTQNPLYVYVENTSDAVTKILFFSKSRDKIKEALKRHYKYEIHFGTFNSVSEKYSGEVLGWILRSKMQEV